MNCERFKVTFLNNCRWQLGESEGETQTERFSNCLDIELTGKSAKGGSPSERDLDSLQVKMINYLQSFFGPGNFLWFLLRGALQGPGPRVMLSELLLFPIIVQNLSLCAFFFHPAPHSLTIFYTLLFQRGRKAKFSSVTHEYGRGTNLFSKVRGPLSFRAI